MKARRILVMDDDKDIVQFLTGLLQKAGYTVLIAMDAAQAVMRAQRERPDLVLTDMLMPAGGGLSVLERLTQSVKTMAIPVLVLTGSSDPDLGARARAREADQVVAMRELALTAADRVLNPLNIIALSLETLRQDGISPEARERAVEKIERAIQAVTRVVRQMGAIARYAPREVTRGLREIDLDTAIGEGAEGTRNQATKG